MTEKNGILDYVTKAAERAAKAETFLEAIAVYVTTERFPDKKTILALATMGMQMPEPEEPDDEQLQEVDDGK